MPATETNSLTAPAAQIAEDVTVVTLPKGFIRDCIECDCDVGEYNKSGQLIATDAQLTELIDRARHYADVDGPDQAPRGLKMSAKALLAALDRLHLVPAKATAQ